MVDPTIKEIHRESLRLVEDAIKATQQMLVLYTESNNEEMIKRTEYRLNVYLYLSILLTQTERKHVCTCKKTDHPDS